MEEGRSTFKILTGKATGNKPLGRSRRRWEDNIRIDFKEMGINTFSWVHSVHYRDQWEAFVHAALNFRVS